MVLGWTAVAQAVPVDLLKPAVPFDVACDGAVDEAAMLNVVRCWIEECNIELSAIGESDEKHIIRSLLDMDEMPLSALWNSNVKEEIAGLVEPVLERWDRVMANKESLSSSDQKILAMLDSLGLIPAREEGAVFPRLNYAFFYKRVHFSPEGRAFVDVLVSQPLCKEELGGEDGLVFWSQNDMADWAAQLENFLRDNAGNPYAPDALKRYQAIINLMLFQDIPPRGQDGVMERWNWWKTEMLGNIAKKHQGTLTGTLVEEFMVSVDANGQKVPKDLERRLSARIDAEFAPGKTEEAAAEQNEAEKVQYYEGKGVINNRIPVAVWFDSKDGLVSGEVVYTKTKTQTPIRLLGRKEKDGSYRLYEVLPNGDISGTITGFLIHGVLSGTWVGRPRMIEQSEGRYEFKEGKEFPIRVNAVDRTHAPYKWTFDAKNASGTYAYSTGDNCDDGTVALQIQEDGSVRYRIIGLTGAPSYRTACFPEDALSGETAAATLHGNRILIEEDENCAIELSLYSDFLVSRYLEGRYCQHLVGNGATAEGLFIKKTVHE